jgi:hypothetical protein
MKTAIERAACDANEAIVGWKLICASQFFDDLMGN